MLFPCGKIVAGCGAKGPYSTLVVDCQFQCLREGAGVQEDAIHLVPPKFVMGIERSGAEKECCR
jgi:hypothetical protein